jgi:hypothetical protein
MRILYLLLFLLPVNAFAQNKKSQKIDRESLSRIESGNKLLISRPDSIVSYLVEQFANEQLSPVNAGSFVLTTEVDSGKKILTQSTSFQVNNQAMELYTDFFPLVFSANGGLQNETSPSMREMNSAWFFDIKDRLKENAGNPQFNISSAIYEEAKKVAKRKAIALIVYNSSGKADSIGFDKMSRIAPLPIPVIFITHTGMKKYFSDAIATYNISLSVDITADLQSKTSVAAFLDNKAQNTIIICTPYVRGSTNEMNPGGVTALAELAASLKQTQPLTNNYLFIAFPDNTIDAPDFTYLPTAALDGLNIIYTINLGAIASYNHTEALTVNDVPSGWAPTFNATPTAPSLNVKVNEENPSTIGILGNPNAPVFYINTQRNVLQEINSQYELELIRFIQKSVEPTGKEQSTTN